MKNALEAIGQIKSNPGKTAIFSDLDGTLSEIAPTPADAIVAPEIREIIEAIARKYAVFGIVSGRDSDDARRIVDVENIIYVGNHGLEWVEGETQYYTPEAFDFFDSMTNLGAELIQSLGISNIIIERKKLGVAVHYRLSNDADKAEARIKDVMGPLAQKYKLKMVEGKYVVELKPDLPVNKGDAIVTIAYQHGVENALYLGDDITDVDAFRTLRALREKGLLNTVSIGVGSDEVSPEVINEADYVVESVDEVREILRRLV